MNASSTMRVADISLAVFTLYGLSAGVLWLSVRRRRPHASRLAPSEAASEPSASRAAVSRAQHNGAAARERAAHHDDGTPPERCPLTGRRCEGDLAYLCEDYGCARKAGLSPHSAENF